MANAAQEQGKILFISELNNRTTEFVTRLLNHEGFNFDYVAGLSEGLEQARRDRPDLLLVEENVEFPFQSEVTRQCSTDERLQTIPILLLLPRKHRQFDLPEADFTNPPPNGWLKAPVDIEEFIRLCRHLLQDS